MESSQEHLRNIALEGFDFIEKFYGRRSTPNDAFPGRRDGFWAIHQVPNGEMEKPTLKPKEVPNYTTPASNYPRGKPQNRWGRPTKF
ncbi:unnamed protein product [Sphenostylis stenocarpa]|uniref:Uncharacterized protein n=1 Tax=Sphenostylis stenocarpa TaxID=92480 RepID=A0AA86VSL0_9FABA|nr:unnamed protein product [Sphenostylis stenocarpa]